MCYECDSSANSNCFEVEPTSSVAIGMHCETSGTREENCFYAHISGNLSSFLLTKKNIKIYLNFLEHKKRKMVRGCKKTGYCNRLENHEQSNIYFKVLSCGECTEAFCNSSNKLTSSVTVTSTFLIALIFALKCVFNM